MRTAVASKPAPKQADELLLSGLPETAFDGAYGRCVTDFCGAGIAKIEAMLCVNGRLSQDLKLFMSHGRERISDARIIETLAELLNSRSHPVRCLEVGAGTSYGSNHDDYGAPWLSRRLAEYFGAEVAVTVSDIVGLENASLFYSSRFGYRSSTLTFKDINNTVFSRREEHGCYRPVTMDDLKRLGRRCDDRLREKMEDLTRELTLTGGSAEGVVIRPSLDPLVEAAFGLRTVHNVDYLKLPGPLAGEKFDFIFGRHLVPVGSQLDAFNAVRNSIIEAGLSDLLNPGGRALLWFDRGAAGDVDTVLAVEK